MKKKLERMTNREYEASLINQITKLENDLWKLQEEYQKLLYMYTELVKKGA